MINTTLSRSMIMSNTETTQMTKERWDKIVEFVDNDLTFINIDFWKEVDNTNIISEKEKELIISVLKNNVPF